MKKDNKLMDKIYAVLMRAFVFVLGACVCYFVLTLVLGWKPPIKDYESISKLAAVKDYVEQNYYKEVDNEKIMDSALAGMLFGLGDKYTRYLSKDQWNSLQKQVSGNYAGIGVTLSVAKEKPAKIMAVAPETPAEKAGMKVGDIICKINGNVIKKGDGEKAVSIINKASGEISITVLRHGAEIELSMEKAEVNTKNATSKIIDLPIGSIATKEAKEAKEVKEAGLSDSSGSSAARNNRIGYIKIDSFDSDVSKDFRKELDGLEEKGAAGLIIDVRNNPGGDYEQVCKICDMLLGECTIVYTQDRQGRKEVKTSDKDMYDKPIVILVNKNSASASEVLTGALKDNKRAEVVGNTTYGKGLVQSSIAMDDGSGFMVTIARYFTPSGVCIHGKGIEPDYKLKGSKKQYRKAIFVLTEKLASAN